MQEEEQAPRSIVVVGVTGDGKSSTCNTLSGSTSIAVSAGFASETSHVAHKDYLHISGEGELNEMRVIDTIGLHDTGLPAEEVMRRLSAFSDLVPLGISCFLFVARYGRFKPEHEAAVDAFVRNVGEDALAHTLLVFTGCTLDASELADALEKNAPESLRKLMPRLAGPPIGIDNLGQAKAAREALHSAIDGVITCADGTLYTHAALAEARKRYDAKREEERAAFASAVSDWRKTGSGPVQIEREFEKINVSE